MGVATSADDFLKDCLSSVAGVEVDARIVDEGGVEGTWEDLSEIGDRLLMEFLGVADVAEGEFIEEEFYINR